MLYVNQYTLYYDSLRRMSIHLFHVVCQYTLYYDSTYAMMTMSCEFVGLYDHDSDS